jgi:hypothetical protein
MSTELSPQEMSGRSTVRMAWPPQCVSSSAPARRQTGHQQRLDEQLPAQACTGDAEREPHGNLAAALQGARQQQVHDVGARDEQDDRRHTDEPERDRGVTGQALWPACLDEAARQHLAERVAPHGVPALDAAPENRRGLGFHSLPRRAARQPTDGLDPERARSRVPVLSEAG